MKKNTRFLAAGICAFLSVLFVFSANVLSSEVPITDIETDVAYSEGVEHGDYGDLDEMNKDDDEYKKNDYGEEYEEYKEGTEERDEEFERDQSDSEDESSTEEPSE